MNKRMRELQSKMQAKMAEAKSFLKDGDVKKAEEVMGDVENLKKEYKIEGDIFLTEKETDKPDPDKVPEPKKDDGEEDDPEKKSANGFSAMTKMATGKRLNKHDKAWIVDGTDGENYLLPEDVRLEIRELRRQYVSAKDLLSITPTTALTGSFNYEAGDIKGLVSFVDGAEIDSADQPKFTRKPFTIGFFGKLIPVSNILQGAEKAGLMGYLNKWFVKNAILTENKTIFKTLKKDKTAKAVKGWEQLKKSINTDLDPDILLDAVIVTNQNGFAILDEEKDEMGRPILQTNPADPTKKLFQGLEIKVFSNAQLPDEAGKAPIFYGSLKAGAEFMDFQALQFATSEHYFFGKNQTAIRIIEGFSVDQTDTDAYIYGTFEATAPVAP